MNEIMKKTYELIDVLEDSDLIHDVTLYRDKIMDNSEIRDMIQEGNLTSNEYKMLDIKRKLYKNSDYKTYIERYNELMYLVMDINYRYSKLLGKGSCRR